MTLQYIDNELTMHGHRLKDIAGEYGTPLFVYDETMIRQQCHRFHTALQDSGLNYTISYASKAFSAVQLFNMMAEEDMGLDVVSEGELYTALQSNVAPERIHFHGNNKTDWEILYAIESGVEYFVIDSLDEIARIDRLATKQVKAVLRINPGVEAHTHEFIQTGQEDSKFGLSIKKRLALEGVRQIEAAEHIDFMGVHFHIGSQIFESTGTVETVKLVIEWLKENDIDIQVLNIGGGFSIKYTDDDVSYPIEEGIKTITQAVQAACEAHSYPVPELSLEPGRSIVGEAGITLYEVGTIKEIPDTNYYVSIDGGMSDHIRTALYDAKYELRLVDREETHDKTMTIAGKLCESGDIIRRDIKLPASIKRGDLLAVLSTGAYHYSMSSNYNQMVKPAVVFVSESGVRPVIKRQTLAQLIQNDII
ncbi:diaminopimelate decarboxylase [Macrococcus hajekii]|uniref:Diaminopimelate decarboxylase n=1 Tax=Macrococcus hajekii TaxID=198482 RepID=A0A4R6BJI3_9STAP|nr:diaminopimelate decarboxylase [Macrococcus hajekii]TDM01746.1 diaminopimelate decarboxylase [Macrococcus hajekii]GGB07083.1 diaminopimelate decarboxylase [Macrococcus hajekii]